MRTSALRLSAKIFRVIVLELILRDYYPSFELIPSVYKNPALNTFAVAKGTRPCLSSVYHKQEGYHDLSIENPEFKIR